MPTRTTPARSGPALAAVLGQASTDKRIDILRRLGECGSISEAARQAGVSYKAAWQALETLSNLAGTPLVAKAVGGSGGGGAQLTPAGLEVLQAAARLEAARAAALRPGPGTAGLQANLARAALALRTSMRNQLPCTVQALRQAAGQVRVELVLPGGQLLQARITRESAQLLQLAPGLPVLALCKATAVQVAATLPAAEGRNLLAGTVQRASRATAGGEVALQLPGPLGLVGFSGGASGLRAGKPAMAAVDEAGVVIATTG